MRGRAIGIGLGMLLVAAVACGCVPETAGGDVQTLAAPPANALARLEAVTPVFNGDCARVITEADIATIGHQLATSSTQFTSASFTAEAAVRTLNGLSCNWRLGRDGYVLLTLLPADAVTTVKATGCPGDGTQQVCVGSQIADGYFMSTLVQGPVGFGAAAVQEVVDGLVAAFSANAAARGAPVVRHMPAGTVSPPDCDWLADAAHLRTVVHSPNLVATVPLSYRSEGDLPGGVKAAMDMAGMECHWQDPAAPNLYLDVGWVSAGAWALNMVGWPSEETTVAGATTALSTTTTDRIRLTVSDGTNMLTIATSPDYSWSNDVAAAILAAMR